MPRVRTARPPMIAAIITPPPMPAAIASHHGAPKCTMAMPQRYDPPPNSAAWPKLSRPR